MIMLLRKLLAIFLFLFSFTALISVLGSIGNPGESPALYSGSFITLLLGYAGWRLWRKESNKVGNISFKISTTTDTDQHFSLSPVKKVSNGWLINPGATFPLTIYEVDKEIAIRIRTALDWPDEKHGKSETAPDLTAIIARYNVGCREIDDMIDAVTSNGSDLHNHSNGSDLHNPLIEKNNDANIALFTGLNAPFHG